MPREYLIDFTERAQVAYDRHPKAIQLRIDQLLHRIQQMGPRQPYTVRLRSPDKVYLARVTNELRIVFQIEEDVMTILDIVTRDQLHHLSRFYI